MVYGILERKTERDHSLVLLRSPELTEKLFKEFGSEPPKKDYYDDGEGKLALLKDRLRKSDLVGRDGYRSLKEFGESVEEFLRQGLATFFPRPRPRVSRVIGPMPSMPKAAGVNMCPWRGFGKRWGRG